jgi:hypothetical protein
MIGSDTDPEKAASFFATIDYKDAQAVRKITAFYAWQSDTPQRFNRHLIRVALEDAANRITEDSALDVELTVDQDTAGVPGQPPITDTILKKIAACDIFIPDLSFVARTGGGKFVPNPNVMTEYGYALRAKTHEALMPVMNTAFGPPKELPFDMWHLRHPIQYYIEPTAKPAQRRTTRQALSQQLEVSLRLQIAATQPAPPAPVPFPEAQAKDGPARFREPGEALGIRDGARFIDAGAGNSSIFFAPGPAMWLRLMPPFDPGKPWTSFQLRAALNQGINLPTLIGPANDSHTIRASDGVGTCIIYSAEEHQTDYVAFVFESGEVWAISTYPLATHPEDLFVGEIEKMLTDRLPGYAQFLATLGMGPPYRWIAGLTGVRGRELQYPVAPERMRIPGWGSHKCVSEHIVSEGSYDRKQSPTNALLPLFNEIYNKCGIARPEHLPR